MGGDHVVGFVIAHKICLVLFIAIWRLSLLFENCGPKRNSAVVSVPRVCVNNLQDRGEKGELWRVFGKFGPLTNVWVADNPPGFAYVFFENFKDAEDAVRHLDGGKICGMKVEVKLSPIDDKRGQRSGFVPRGRGRGNYSSNAAGGGGRGGYKSRGGGGGGFSSPPDRPSRFEEDSTPTARSSAREGRSDYREARSGGGAYTERYSDRSEKGNYGREKEDYGPPSQSRGGPYATGGRGGSYYQGGRGPGRGDYSSNNGGSGGYSRYAERSPHRAGSSSRGRGGGGYRGEGGGGYEGGHHYARGHPNTYGQYSSRDGGKGRLGGEYARKPFASAPVGEYEKRPRDSKGYERGREYATDYEHGGRDRSDVTYREHRYRSAPDKYNYRGPPKAYQKKGEVPDKEYRKPQEYSDVRGRDRSPHRRPAYSSVQEGGDRYEERPAKERKRSLSPTGDAFGREFDDHTPPPVTHYEAYPEGKQSQSQDGASPEPNTRFSPAHSDYGGLPEEGPGDEGGEAPMEDIDQYPKDEDYVHDEAQELPPSGVFKERRVEYEGREVRELKYEGHHEKERSRSGSGPRSPIRSPIRTE